MADDRHAWIRNRIKDGYDFGPLVAAISKIRVHSIPVGCLLLDLSLLERDAHYPSQIVLEPGPDGRWRHEGSGEFAPLPEWLLTVALSCLERDGPFVGLQIEGADDG